jgi:hypothetical protein
MPKYYPTLFITGGIAGAILFMIVSFSAGWIVTSGRSDATVKESSEQAVVDSLVPICVHQFRGQADNAAQLDTLRGMDEWKREDFVQDKGWSTMPGSESPAAGVARECAAFLTKKTS